MAPPVAAVRVMVASGVRLVREGLALALASRESIVVTGAVDLDAAGLARIAEMRPDVVLVDLGSLAAVEGAERLRGAWGPAKLVAFALHEAGDEVIACAAAGYSGYVSRDCDAENLSRSLVDAARGRMRCAPHIAAALFGRLSELLRAHPPGDAVLPELTARETAILALAGEGQSNKEIARELRISSATVKNHMHNILQKLQVDRRGQAVARLRAGRGI